MNELTTLMNDIEKLRESLNRLIREKHGIVNDPEIVSLSQVLNVVIAKYNEIVSKKLDNGQVL